MSESTSSLSSSLLPLILSQYEKAKQSGQTASSSAESLSSMISSFGSSDDSSDESSGSDISSLLSNQQGSSNLSSLLSNSGSSENSSSYANMLSSLLSSGALGSSASSSSSLLSSLLGSSSDTSSLLSSLTGSDSSSTSDLLSSGLLSSSSSSSSSSYQQLLAKLMLEKYESSEKTSSSNQINQFTADKLNGGDGINQDDAPTSLVMALHELGMGVAGEVESNTDGQAIDLARLSMAGTTSKDGLTSSGKYSDAEHNTSMNLDDVQRGAAAAGVKTETLNASSSDIMHYLQEGGQVVVSGTFNDKSSLPWTGDSSKDKTSAPGGAGNHIVEVSSYDSFTKLFTVNDPARSTPVQVTASTLDYFMSGNAGAVGMRL